MTISIVQSYHFSVQYNNHCLDNLLNADTKLFLVKCDTNLIHTVINTCTIALKTSIYILKLYRHQITYIAFEGKFGNYDKKCIYFQLYFVLYM